MTFRRALILALCMTLPPMGASLRANPEREALANPTYDASKVRPKILELFNDFAENPLVCDFAVGAGGTTPPCYSIVHTIADQASPEELVMLTRHKAPGVRANALIALLYAKQDELFLEIIPQHFHDFTRLTWFSGCSPGSVGLAEIVLSRAQWNLSDEAYRRLQEKLIYFEGSTEVRYMAFQVLPLAVKHEKRVRELATQKSPGAALALAHYRKDSDVSIIQSIQADRAAEFFESVQAFPHEAFKDDLEESYDSIMAPKDLYYGTEYFMAIAAYRDDWARSMLRRPYGIHFFTDSASARSSVMYAITMEKQMPFYKDLIWEFSDSQPMGHRAFKTLCEEASRQCTEYVRRALTHIEEFKLVYAWDQVRTYTDYLRQNDPALLKELIIEQLELEQKRIPSPFLGVIQESRDPDYVEPALDFIEESPEQWSQRDLGIVLLKFGDAAIKKRLLELRNRKAMLRTKKFQEALDRWEPRKP